MPIEIRELVIKATVLPENNSGANLNAPTNNAVSSNEEMINACVEKIFETLKAKNER